MLMEKKLRSPIVRTLATSGLFICIMIVCLGNSAYAQDETTDSAEDVAKKLANPNASIGFFAVPIDYISYRGTLPGASSQSAYKVSFQPSLPYVIKAGMNLFLRPLIPVILSQSTINENGDFVPQGVDLGDIGFDAAFGITHPSKWITIFGVAGSAPTASAEGLGTGRWMLGPNVFIGKGGDWGLAGILIAQTWSLTKNSSNTQTADVDDFIFINDNSYPNSDGSSNNTLSITAGQYFYTINLKNAWQIQSQPVYTFNHGAAKGSRFSFPLGTGIAKTMVAGKLPLKFSLQYWYYVTSAEAYGPQHQIRLQIAPVVPLPW